MPENNRELSRVIIDAYKDKDFAQSSKAGSFEIPLNPEQYSQNFKVDVDVQRGSGNQGTNTKFKSTAPEQLKLDFLLDNTGTIAGNHLDGTDVRKQVDSLLKVVYKMNGDIHQPNFLKLMWGSNSFASKASNHRAFTCVLGNLDINYILFDRDGEPLRAKVSATFINYVAQEARVREEGKESPDLTHIRTVNEGDKLPLMTFEVYSDQSYYQKVAKSNGLTSFRKLKPGDRIVFPPIEKA